ncbi:glycosyltransferase [Pedobacter jejuensis]|uniref:Glycosyltransferase n=1 Tax=Pedobacter jejuensis TaxID=1268550 RepID=A0A3N0BQS7_9SPHI|nr:glycosyltransferase [Pedobacter jejuensis]RNL51130.1 glycosyltransferase [Pedobacter jejuensis]
MKIALVTAYFYPKSTGGTEKYVLNLAKRFISELNEVHVITVGISETNFYECIKVHYVADELSNDNDIISGKKPSNNLEEFRKLLEDNRYDLVHFHTLTPAFNIYHIQAAKELNSAIHFTAHVPDITCLHGDLMKFGKEPCDGAIITKRCLACYISKKGINETLSKCIAETAIAVGFPKQLVSAIDTKKRILATLNKLCDKIFLFTNWQKEIFLMNGFDFYKLHLTSQLFDKELIPQKQSKKAIKNIAFVGRISYEKGLHILIDVFNLANRKDLKLHIAGIVNDIKYYDELKKISSKNSNIYWDINLSAAQIDQFYKQIDLLVIPSITYETGPFVLYEALERSIPVLANELGDMKLWKEKGFEIGLYNRKLELEKILNEL